MVLISLFKAWTISGRCIFRRKNAVPHVDVDLASFGFGEGGYIGEQWMTLIAANAQGHQLASFDLRQSHMDGQEHGIDLAAQQIGHCGCRASIRNVRQKNTGRVFEQLHGQVMGRCQHLADA